MRFLKFTGALFVLALVVLAGLSLRQGEDQTSEPDAQPTPTASESPSREPEVIAITKQDAARLNDRVKAFSRLYFSLNPAISNEEVEESVRPYATTAFMETALFGFGTSEADMAMLQEQATLKVRATSDLVGQTLSDGRVAGSVTLRITKYDRNGRVVLTFSRQQQMTWEKSGETWLVLEAPRT